MLSDVFFNQLRVDASRTSTGVLFHDFIAEYPKPFKLFLCLVLGSEDLCSFLLQLLRDSCLDPMPGVDLPAIIFLDYIT